MEPAAAGATTAPAAATELPVVSVELVIFTPQCTDYPMSHSIRGRASVEGMGKHFLPVIVRLRLPRV